MPSAYPGALDALNTSLTDGTDAGDDTPGSTAVGTHAAHHNNLADAINKIEAELGIAPSDSYDTVRARLDAIVAAMATDAELTAGLATKLSATSGSQSIAYSATITPDADAGQTVIVGALTGDLTVAAPTNAAAGKVLRFVIPQDSTGGRTVTWNSAFDVPNNKPAPGPSKITTWEFVYDGTKWRQQSVEGISTDWFVNIVDYGASTGSSDNTAAIQRALDALPYSAGNTHLCGGILYVPSGSFTCTGTLYADGMTNLTIMGAGSSGAGSRLLFSTAAAPGLSARSTSGLRISGLSLVVTDSAYSGTILTLQGGYSGTHPTSGRTIVTRDTTLWELSDLTLYGPASSGTTCDLLDLRKATVGTCRLIYFRGGRYQARGWQASGDYANAITFDKCLFDSADVMAVHNPHQSWHFAGCCWEPLRNGNAGAVYSDPSSPGALCLSFDGGCQMVDAATGGSAGTWVETFGRVISFAPGFYFQHGTTGLKLNGATIGLSVLGCNFELVATGINVNSQTLTAPHITGNSWNTVTTKIANYSAPTGGILLDDTIAWYRRGTGFIGTDLGIDAGLTINAGTEIRARAGHATAETKIGAVGPSSKGGMTIGPTGAADTNLYRDSAGVLKTDGALVVSEAALGLSPGYCPSKLEMEAYGFKATNLPLSACLSNGSAVAAGVVHLDRVEIPDAISVRYISFLLYVIGATVANGYVGIYNSAGTLIASSSDIGSTLHGTTGMKTIDLGASYSLSAGFVWVAYVVGSAGTMPQLARTAGFNINGGSMTGDTRRCADYSSGLTALPTPLTLASLADSTRNTWWALS